MGVELGDLTLQIVLSTAEVQTGVQQTTTALGGLETKAKETGEGMQKSFDGGRNSAHEFLMGLGLTTIGFGMLGSKAKDVLKDVVDDFLKAEQANTKLLFSLQNNADAFERMDASATQMMTHSIFDDEDIKNAMSFEAVQGRTEDQIKKTVQAALNLQAVTGGDLQSNIMKLDMTYEGSIGRLGRLDSRLKDLSTEELMNGKAVDIINDKYQGFADKMSGTYSGSWTKYWNIVKEATNILIESFLKGENAGDKFGAAIGTATKILGWMTPGIKAIVWGLGELKDGMDVISRIYGNIFGGMERAITNVDVSFQKLNNDIWSAMYNFDKNGITIFGGKGGNADEGSNRGQGMAYVPPTSGTGSKSGTGNTPEEIKSKLQEINEQLADAHKKYDANTDSLVAQAEILKEIVALEEQKAFYEGKFSDVLIPDLTGLIPGTTEKIGDRVSGVVKRGSSGLGTELSKETVSGYDKIKSDLSASAQFAGIISGKLDEGGRNFFSFIKMAMSALSQVAGLMDKTGGIGLSDILPIFGTIIGFLAGGGDAESGRPYIVGENGPELFIPGQSGTVMSNAMSGDILNRASGGSSPNITVIVQSEVERTKATKFFTDHFPNYTNRLNKGNIS